ncbi:hypothetical protein CANCADRAFT_15490, partial [Tortispora caseinolytica NRRL Y-17796]
RNISIDRILSNVSDIPSSQARTPSYTERSVNTSPTRLAPPRDSASNSSLAAAQTSKVSQKLVLLPESEEEYDQYGYAYEDMDEYDDDMSPMWDDEAIQRKIAREHMYQQQEPLHNQDHATAPKRTYAEKMPKAFRAEKLPRVTAYCTAEGYRLLDSAKFLHTNHNVLPKVFEEVAYVCYALPLLPGINGCRVRSSAAITPFNAINKARNSRSPPRQSNTSGPESTSQQHSPAKRDNNDDDDEQQPEFASGATRRKSWSTPEMTKMAELFIFSYGVVVFWNFSESQEKDILADLAFANWRNPALENTKVPKLAEGVKLIVRPISDQEIETEEFNFEYLPYTRRPRIYNDMITLRSGDHMIKLTMSHAIAQSTKLCRFEARMASTMGEIQHIPKTLALLGKLGMDREQVMKLTGKLFKLRVDVNLSSNVLDTPDFFWESEPTLHPLYTAVREYLEIDQRILVLNERCKVFLELTDIIQDSIADINMQKITWIIILLIVVSLFVEGVEIALRFRILS